MFSPCPSWSPSGRFGYFSYLREVYHPANIIFKAAGALLVVGLALLGSCRSGPDEKSDVHAPQAPATMMAALHTMVQHSQALPQPGNLDLYFAQLMRENHQAAVAMSALELKRGHDPQLLDIARDIHRAHQRLILGLDSAIARLRALPPAFPEHTSQSHDLNNMLDSATVGLHPAAHRVLAGEEGQHASTRSLTQKQEAAGTGSIDRDYAALFMPHHRNSLTLARAELQFGRDERLQQVAYFVLRDQEREIEQVRAWLHHHPIKHR